MCIRIINNIISEPGEPFNGENAITSADVEACHRLRVTNSDNVKNTIIRLKNRKHCDLIFINIFFLVIQKLKTLVNQQRTFMSMKIYAAIIKNCQQNVVSLKKGERYQTLGLPMAQ